MRRKGQGTFEYILLLAGVLLIVVLAIVLIRGGLFQPSQQSIQRDACRSALAQSTACYDAQGAWQTTGTVTPIPNTCVQFAPTTPAGCTGNTFGECVGGAAGGCTAFCCGPKIS